MYKNQIEYWKCKTELRYMYPSAHVVIAGDLNARTKDLIDYIRNDDIFYVYGGEVE